MSLFSGPGGYSQSAVLWYVFESGKVVTELALQTQLWPGPCIQPQEAPLALQFSIYRDCPDTVRVLPHRAIQMSLDWTEHQCHYDWQWWKTNTVQFKCFFEVSFDT